MQLSRLKNALFACVQVIILGLAPSISCAQSQLFQGHDVLALTLAAPFSKVNRSRGEGREYFPATLEYTQKDGTEISIKLQVRTRGLNRSRDDICRYPPLRLNFDKDQLDGTLFAGENILKLVTHCQPQTRYEQFVLLEYLDYRLFNLFTDRSFRVRLVDMTYLDTDTGDEQTAKTAFFIEDDAAMAARLKLQRFNSEKIDRRQYDKQELNFVELFQYLLGNTDWSAVVGAPGEACCHNIVPLISADNTLVPVPYDFDATGVVNPPYAAPSTTLNINNVRQRLYRGFCQPDEVLQSNLAIFRERESDVHALIRSQIGLDKRTLSRTTDYVDAFFATINNPEQLQKKIIDACR
jgi:hypothetical protein